MMIPLRTSGGGGPHETPTVTGPSATTLKFTGGPLGPIIK